MRTYLSFESYHPLFSLIGNGHWRLLNARAGSDLVGLRPPPALPIPTKTFFQRSLPGHPYPSGGSSRVSALFGRIDLKAGINQALKHDPSHFRRICDRRRKVLSVTPGVGFVPGL
jgi:hypothetical protein